MLEMNKVEVPLPSQKGNAFSANGLEQRQFINKFGEFYLQTWIECPAAGGSWTA